MGPSAVYGLLYLGLGLALLLPDLRLLWRFQRWPRARGVIVSQPTAFGTVRAVEFTLPNGEAVRVPGNGRALAGHARDGQTVTVAYDPHAPGRAAHVVRGLGLGLAMGLVLVALGVRTIASGG